MSTLNELAKSQQRMAKLERGRALAKIKKRKLDTRRKIELGGLVIKAGMDVYGKGVVLGALITIKSMLNDDACLVGVYKSIGRDHLK